MPPPYRVSNTGLCRELSVEEADSLIRHERRRMSSTKLHKCRLMNVAALTTLA